MRVREQAAALILAGGRSTRFWPEGRARRPKPLFALNGKSSLLADTIARVQPPLAPERIFVLVGADHADLFKRAVRGLIPPRNVIVEPEARGTAVAIAYGAAMIAQRLQDQTIIAAMPADHYIPQTRLFQRALSQAIDLAARPDTVVAIGITPTRPETGYGYQAIGRAVGAGFRVTHFVEKPNLATARRMIRAGKFLWNSGIYVMSVATLGGELQQHAPALAAAMRRFAIGTPAQLRGAYRALKVDSFDRVVAERSRNLFGVHARFRWDDVGSWEGVWEALRGGADSVAAGNVLMLDSHGVLARGGKRLMVVLGLSDLVAIDTEDAILIARRSRSQELARVFVELKRRGLQKYL
ncbi:MAG TPA: sugar phosphate nucleotidyltransferase [Candidatus Binataceae bacterium]|nr:sugar phosphate nucleotidyltransferase [Candidatus Binataceae bacterium]